MIKITVDTTEGTADELKSLHELFDKDFDFRQIRKYGIQFNLIENNIPDSVPFLKKLESELELNILPTSNKEYIVFFDSDRNNREEFETLEQAEKFASRYLNCKVEKLQKSETNK